MPVQGNTVRSDALDRFLVAADVALLSSIDLGSPEELAATLVFARAWAEPGGMRPAYAPKPADLPVLQWLTPALDLASDQPRGAVARALSDIVPDLHWGRRQSARPDDGPFWDGHANAMILGPGGIEERADLWIGATLMAPEIAYPEHSHPPEEVYLPLTPGEWWNEDMDWTDPGAGGVVYNRPGICHMMRSGRTPFLALWFLPV